MVKWIRQGIMFSLFICLPYTVHAQSNVYLGPHIGIQKSGDAEDANYLVGANLRLKLSSSLGAEGSIGYRQEKYMSDAVTVRDWPVTVTGLLYPLHAIYGGVGAGWYNTTYDYSDALNTSGYGDNTAQEFGWHLAAGIEVTASPSLKLFGDVRYVFIDREFRELPGAFTGDINSDFYSITAGLLFRL